MAQQGSVAPKERVNVVYRPATGDAKEEVELPLKVLVMGDFTLREDDRAVEDRKPINIDKDNFNDVLAGQKLQLKTAVPDTLSREPDAEMNLELDFKSIKDFTPDAIVEKVPQLKQLLELREALKLLKGRWEMFRHLRKSSRPLLTMKSPKQSCWRSLVLKNRGAEK